MKVPFLDLACHHAPLREEINNAIDEVIDGSAFAGGPFVARFEAHFAAYCKCLYAIGVGSGTEALWLTLLASGLGPGDEVITVPNTFIATDESSRARRGDYLENKGNHPRTSIWPAG
jgi:dTDP-4-amino-4,6-dideoxygalactose transaminase